MVIAQFTDTHITPPGEDWKSDSRSQVHDRLSRVVKRIGELKPDLVVATGDLVDGSDLNLAYDEFIRITAPLSPYYLIPGNHDEREILRNKFKDRNWMPPDGPIDYEVNDTELKIVLFDTLIQGKNEGEITEEQCERFTESLARDPQKKTMIFMHHIPVSTGWRLFDGMTLKAPPAFEKAISDSENVIGTYCGHYHHQAFSPAYFPSVA